MPSSQGERQQILILCIVCSNHTSVARFLFLSIYSKTLTREKIVPGSWRYLRRFKRPLISQSGETVSHTAHNREKVGSTPTSATKSKCFPYFSGRFRKTIPRLNDVGCNRISYRMLLLALL